MIPLFHSWLASWVGTYKPAFLSPALPPGLFPLIPPTCDTMPVSRVYLLFLVVVLQVIIVEGKKGGGGGGGKGKGGGGGGGGGSGSGRLGLIAGIVAGMDLPNPASFSVLTTPYSGIAVIVISLILKFRAWVKSLFRRCPNERDNTPHTGKLTKANKLSKKSDLEGGTLKGYTPPDVPFYVSIHSAPFTAFHMLTRSASQTRRHLQSNTTRWIGKESLLSFLLNLTQGHRRSLLNLTQCHLHSLLILTQCHRHPHLNFTQGRCHFLLNLTQGHRHSLLLRI